MEVENKKIIVHISEVSISKHGGMARIEYFWREAFKKAGYEFIHIGPEEVGSIPHKALFPYKAYQYYKKLNIKPIAFIAHEPVSGVFSKRGIPCFIESHGIERRYWNLKLNGISTMKEEPISLKTRILYPLWRLRNCDKGLRNADKLMLSNSDDRAYAMQKFNRSEKDVFIFKNGINISESGSFKKQSTEFTVLFNASWIDRKGIYVLIDAAKLLYKRKLFIKYLLIGTGSTEQAILSEWPDYLQPFVTVIPRFEAKDEIKLLAEGSVFVLPSFFEGQPLSLVQAMSVGKCCITTNCCGQKDLIKDKENGFLFEIGDSETLSELIKKCYDDPTMTKEIEQKAKFFVKDMTWQKVSDEVVAYVLKNSSL